MIKEEDINYLYWKLGSFNFLIHEHCRLILFENISKINLGFLFFQINFLCNYSIKWLKTVDRRCSLRQVFLRCCNIHTRGTRARCIQWGGRSICWWTGNEDFQYSISWFWGKYGLATVFSTLDGAGNYWKKTQEIGIWNLKKRYSDIWTSFKKLLFWF